jgi:hypothetical protein
LTGKIEPSALVKITPEQLADQKVKLERERAAQEALRDKVLTPGYNKDEASNGIQYLKPSWSKHSPPFPDKKRKESIMRPSQGQGAKSDSLEYLKKSDASSPSVYSNHGEESSADNNSTSNVHGDLSDDDCIPIFGSTFDNEFTTASSILKISTFKLFNLLKPTSKHHIHLLC